MLRFKQTSGEEVNINPTQITFFVKAGEEGKNSLIKLNNDQSFTVVESTMSVRNALKKIGYEFNN